MSLWPRDLLGRMGPDGGMSVEWNPRCDVTDSEKEIVVHAELPGVEAKDMDVAIQDGVLYVRGEKHSEKKQENGERRYSERFFGSFERAIALPAGVVETKIEANLKDGVLEVRVPRMAVEPPKEKKIAINS
jgi:HSP20 family protein